MCPKALLGKMVKTLELRNVRTDSCVAFRADGRRVQEYPLLDRRLRVPKTIMSKLQSTLVCMNTRFYDVESTVELSNCQVFLNTWIVGQLRKRRLKTSTT